MSVIIGSSTSKNGVEAATDKPQLTPEQVIEQLHALREQIPAFAQLSRTDLKQMRREASVNVDFSRASIGAVGASGIVQSAIGNTPDELHQAEDELSRWLAVEAEFRSVLRGLSAANVVRRHRIGRAALKTYNLSRQLAREEANADLLPHVEAMSRIKRFSRRRPKHSTEVTPPPTQPTKTS